MTQQITQTGENLPKNLLSFGNQGYRKFIESKAQLSESSGFKPRFIPEFLFDFQKHLVEWMIEKGRSALFADCGLGKTAMHLVWSQNVVEEANKPVLILTPLAVSAQTCREAEKFGIEAVQSKTGIVRGAKIIVTNYERLHYFNPEDFAGCVCDESSILKNFKGAIKTSITEFMRRMRYRQLSTATAAPNDYVELGTSSEALGYLGYMDMLGMFFKTDTNTLHPTHARYDAFAGSKFRFKRHAERDFWRWLCSWARAVRKPSDIGFDNANFELPPLITNTHIVGASRPLDGYLFAMPAVGLAEQRKERSHTGKERCEKAAEIAAAHDCAVSWCQLNSEADLLEKLIPDSVQVSGKDSDDAKEEKFEAFQTGKVKRLITKPSIGAFGLNWQHCHALTFFPSHSFEQYYQAVRRCWRFGQKNPVTVEIVTTEGERDVMRNLQRKSDAAEAMFESLVAEMNSELNIKRDVEFAASAQIPTWM